MVILNSGLANQSYALDPHTCVSSSDEARLLSSGAARKVTEADKIERVFDLDAGVWKLPDGQKKAK